MKIFPQTLDTTRSSLPAIAVMCVGVLLLATNDAAAKLLVTRYDPFQIIFVRSVLALPLVVAFVLAMDGRRGLRSSYVRVHALRSVVVIAAGYAYFLALVTLPLAEAASLVFAAPIFITALSVVILRERVGWRRWLAVLAGFVGVLIVIRPGTATFQAASLLVLLSALLYALYMISSRWIDRRDGIRTMLFYVTLFPVFFCSFVVFSEWPEVRATDILLFLSMAAFGTTGITLITQAFRMAPAAIVAPFDYTALVWASLFGWLFWGDIPDMWVYVGAAVIIASGIVLILRDARAGAKKGRDPQAPPPSSH